MLVLESSSFPSRNRTPLPSAHVIREAERAAASALPAHRARRLSAPAHHERWAAENAPRDLGETELRVLGVVRAARDVGAPGVRMTVAAIAELVNRSRRMVQYALEGLGEHRISCKGSCARPGVDGRGRPRCPGCAKPCPRGCQAHLDLVRRVRQFVEVKWRVDHANPCSRQYRRRQVASVLLLGSVARRAERRDAASAIASQSMGPLSCSPSRPPREATHAMGCNGAIAARAGRGKVSASPTASARFARSGAENERAQRRLEAHPGEAPEGGQGGPGSQHPPGREERPQDEAYRRAEAEARRVDGDGQAQAWAELEERLARTLGLAWGRGGSC